MLRRSRVLLQAGVALLLVACAEPSVEPTPTLPTNQELRPIPGLTVNDFAAVLEAAGFQCGRSGSDSPGRSCARHADPDVSAMGTHTLDDGRHVTRIYAYVVAPARNDFDDLATTFFRDVVMLALLQPDERPTTDDIRAAARASGRIVVENLVFQFYESSTTRAMQVTYATP